VRRKRRAALVSAVYHAHRTDKHERAPYFLRPMPLEAAVAHLARDPHLPARVQAAAWLLDNPERSDEHMPHVHALLRDHLDDVPARLDGMQDELDQLGSTVKLPRLTKRPSPRPALTHTQQLAAPPAAPRGGGPRAAGDRPLAIESLPSPGRFGLAYERLTSTGCVRDQFHCSIHLDPETLVTSITAHVDVNKPASSFNQLADPRGWESQAPLFWQESDLGTYASGAFSPNTGLGPVGSFSYADRELLEAVDLSWNPLFPMQGNNLLRATHYNHPELIEDHVACGMHVNLSLSLSTTIGGSQTLGGLDVDNGRVTAQAIGAGCSRTRLTASKSARFTERELCGVKLGLWLNSFAPFFLGPWIATLVFEGACFPTD
jgi:hypothetical protein